MLNPILREHRPSQVTDQVLALDHLVIALGRQHHHLTPPLTADVNQFSYNFSDKRPPTERLLP